MLRMQIVAGQWANKKRNQLLAVAEHYAVTKEEGRLSPSVSLLPQIKNRVICTGERLSWQYYHSFGFIGSLSLRYFLGLLGRTFIDTETLGRRNQERKFGRDVVCGNGHGLSIEQSISTSATLPRLPIHLDAIITIATTAMMLRGK